MPQPATQPAAEVPEPFSARFRGAMRPRPFRMPRIVLALMLREMTSTYGRSPGGYAWAIAQPLGGIMMLTLILAYGLNMHVPSLGINFPLFYATGLLPLMLYQNSAGVVANALLYSKPLLRYPGITFVDALLARWLLQIITKAVVMYLLLGGILMLFETRAILDLPAILTAFAMAAGLGFGIGCLNGYLFPTYPLWASAWGILTFPMFLLSGVFFIYENLPPLGQEILWYNPVIHVTGQMRTGFYPTYHPDYIAPLYVLAWILIPSVLGMLLLRRHYRRIINL